MQHESWGEQQSVATSHGSASNARYYSSSVACTEAAHLFCDGCLGINLLSLHLNLLLNADGVLGLQLQQLLHLRLQHVPAPQTNMCHDQHVHWQAATLICAGNI